MEQVCQENMRMSHSCGGACLFPLYFFVAYGHDTVEKNLGDNTSAIHYICGDICSAFGSGFGMS